MEFLKKWNLSQREQENLYKFLNLVREVNRRINLVSKKNTDKIIKNLTYESLLFLEVLKGDRIVDIGSGAGFPGIPLAIIRQKWDFILIERNKKKAEFLRKVRRELGLNNVRIFDGDLANFRENGVFEFISRGAGYEEIMKILRKNNLKGILYAVLHQKETKYKFKTFKNELTGKTIKIGIMEI